MTRQELLFAAFCVLFLAAIQVANYLAFKIRVAMEKYMRKVQIQFTLMVIFILLGYAMFPDITQDAIDTVAKLAVKAAKGIFTAIHEAIRSG